MPAPISVSGSDTPLKAHPAYRAAKDGDVEAAMALVGDLASPLAVRSSTAFPPGAIYVAPDAMEATGDNAIPGILAAAVAIEAEGEVDRGIVQVNRAFHTGADPMQRMIARALFEGEVRPGGRYVLVDDVTTMGGTLADLAHHIRAGGGEVLGVVVLVCASRTGRLVPDPRLIRDIERRHGNAIREVFGIAPGALTADEAQYLIGFRDADEIRGRAAKAAEERRDRLRAKGIPEGMG